MHRGCISLGDIQCNGCQRPITHLERYLIIEETPGAIQRLCADCSLKKGYAQYRQEKKEQMLTFFPGQS